LLKSNAEVIGGILSGIKLFDENLEYIKGHCWHFYDSFACFKIPPK